MFCTNKRTVLKGSFTILLLLLFAAALIQFLSPESYHIDGGTLSLQLDRAHGLTGQVNIDLGPLGSVKLGTHRTPFDIKASFALDGNQSITDPDVFDSLSTIKTEGLRCVKDFFISRIPWLIILGALSGVIVGMMLSNGDPYLWLRQAGRYCLRGVALTAVIASAIVGFTAGSIDRNYSIEYVGLVANYKEVPSLINKVKSDDAYKNDGIQSLITGLGVVEHQERELYRRRHLVVESNTTRVLCVSDVHDNPDGWRLAENIVKSGRFGRISMILNTGDTTNFGSAWEAGITTQVIPAKPTPVVMDGGNHEAEPAMRAFKKAGYHILNGSVFNVNGLNVFGDDDPSAYLDQVVPGSEDEVLAAAAKSLKVEWDLLSDKPQILLVHNLKQAADVIRETKEADGELVVVYGHDHKVALKQEEGITLVDVGSSGASGFGDIGFDPNSPYTFQILEFFNRNGSPSLFSVTTIAFNGLAEANTVDIKYTPID